MLFLLNMRALSVSCPRKVSIYDSVSNIFTFMTRINRGIYTFDMIPVSICGFIGIMLGRQIGLKILDRIDLNMMKKGVYAFVGISGILTVLQNL